MLDVEVIKEDGSKHYLAVNDAVVARGQLSKTIDLHLTLDGDENVPVLATDRVVIRKSDLKLKLALLHNRNFYKLLNEKLKERDF